LTLTLPQVLPGWRFGEGCHGREGVDDGAGANVAAEFCFDQNDGGDDVGIDAEFFFCRLKGCGLFPQIDPAFPDPRFLGHLVIVEGGFVVQEIERSPS